jgi:hypothetical protein
MIDNQSLWSTIYNPNTKYSASRIDTTTIMKYFNNGVTLMNSSDFRKKYREFSTYEPKSNWVILLSLNGDLDSNGVEILRTRNRTSLVASCSLESIKEGGELWPDPGLALDPKLINYKTTHVNYKTGAITIRATMPHGLQLKETPYDHLPLLRKILTPIEDGMKAYRQVATIDPYESEDGRTLMLDLARTTLSTLGMFTPTAQSVRESLIAILTNKEDPHAYVVKGVAFANEREYQLRLQMIAYGLPENFEMSTALYDNGYGGKITAKELIEMFALRHEHDKPITEQLLNDYPQDANERLRRMTLQQVQWLPDHYNTSVYCDFTIGLTDDEYTQMSNETKDADYTERMKVFAKWRDLMVERWKTLQA